MTTTLVKERPMLFKSAMVRALLDGSKTQSRRIMKPQPEYDGDMLDGVYMFAPPKGVGSDTAFAWAKDPTKSSLLLATCPHGKPGDRIWVKETWGFTAKWPMGFQREHIQGGGPWLPDSMAYRADQPEGYWCWRPSIFMPRWASRILLEITEVRVERLNSITEEDAVAEGINLLDTNSLGGTEWENYLDDTHYEPFAVDSYRTLWQSINGLDSWDENPWVWCIKFRVIN